MPTPTAAAIRAAGGISRCDRRRRDRLGLAREAAGRRRRAARPARHPGEQRRHHARSAVDAHEAGRLGCGAGDQPDRLVHADPGGDAPDAEAARRPDHRGQFGGRADRQRRSDQLRRVESGADRVRESAGARGCVAQRDGQCHRARA